MQQHNKHRPAPLGGFMSMAVRIVGMLLLAGATTLTPAFAQAVAEDAPLQRHVYAIPAGPVEQALSAFAKASGQIVVFTPDRVEGRRSRGLQGEHDVEQALSLLLAGTDLAAERTGEGRYTLRVLPPASGANLLPAVKVSSDALTATTENSGSYTTGVTSSATGLNLALRDTPQSVSVVTHDRMRDQDLTEIGEVLQQVVGIEANNSSSVGTDGVQYIARGFAIENYQVDGISRPTDLYGFAEETADLIAYDRVEVVHGASGLMTGMGVPAATINLIRKRPGDERRSSLAAKIGSWDLRRLEADVGGPLSDGGALRGRLAGAWQENDSFIEREQVERVGLYGIAEADLGAATTLSGGLEYQDFTSDGASRGGVPLYFTDGTPTRFARSTNTGANWSSFERESLNAFASVAHEFSADWRLRVDAEHKNGSYDETIGYLYAGALDPQTGAGGSVYSARWAADLRLDAVYANLQGAFKLLGRRHELALTLTHARYETEGPDYPGWWYGGDYVRPVSAFDFYPSGDAPKPDFSASGGIYGNDAEHSAVSAVVRLRPADMVSVILGSRISDWEVSSSYRDTDGVTTTTPGAKESGVWTPYVGAVVDLSTNLSAYASYTSIFEAQTIKDIDGKVLDPLEGNNYEIGIKGEYLDGRLNAAAAVFRMEQDNYGEALGPGIFAPDGSPAYRAISGAQAQGFEVELGGELRPGWQLAGGIAHVKAEDADGAPLMSNIPENTFKLFSTYRLHGALQGLTVGGNLRWQDSTVAQYPGPLDLRYEQDSLFLTDLLLKCALTPRLSMLLNVDNLFDKTYYSALNTASSRYGEARRLSLTLRYAL